MENRIVALFTLTRSQLPSFASVRWKRAERWRPPSRLILRPISRFRLCAGMPDNQPLFAGCVSDWGNGTVSRMRLDLGFFLLLGILDLPHDDFQHHRLAVWNE